MSVGLSEVISGAGYDLSTIEGAQWLLSQQSEFDELVEAAETLQEEYNDYTDWVDLQEELGNYDIPTFNEWKEK